MYDSGTAATFVESLRSEPLLLTRQEFELLLALVRAPGRVKTRESLLLEVAEADQEGTGPARIGAVIRAAAPPGVIDVVPAAATVQHA